MDDSPARATRVIVNMHVRPGDEEAFIGAWLPHTEACRREPGVRQFELFRSVSFPENFVLVELWDDRDAFDAHFGADHGRDSRSALVDVGTRRHGEDGLEIYRGQRLFMVEGGSPVPTSRRGWGEA
ncbi:putative quinol monooxygenase [Nocardioides sp.]|uniref:putative quinol monooxygenase n=1 Tax=Nocardioides sp. TaxID=35761 RepID=UPI00378327AC